MLWIGATVEAFSAQLRTDRLLRLPAQGACRCFSGIQKNSFPHSPNLQIISDCADGVTPAADPVGTEVAGLVAATAEDVGMTGGIEDETKGDQGADGLKGFGRHFPADHIRKLERRRTEFTERDHGRPNPRTEVAEA